MDRITVSNIFNSESPTTVIAEPYHHIFINSFYIFAVHQTSTLHIFQLKSFKMINTIPLPSIDILAVQSIGELIAFIMNKNNSLSICSMFQQNKRQELKIHIGPINCLSIIGNSFVTGGTDYTIRLWNTKQENIHPFALSGHESDITCLSLYENYLISGSSDKSLKIWKKERLFCSTNFSSSIVHVCPCEETFQIAVFTKDSKISLIKMNKIMKGKPLDIKAVIDNGGHNCIKACQIDDSFMVYSIGKKLVYVEVNLSQIIKENEVEGEITELKSIGRVIICGNQNKGIEMIKL